MAPFGGRGGGTLDALISDLEAGGYGFPVSFWGKGVWAPNLGIYQNHSPKVAASLLINLTHKHVQRQFVLWNVRKADILSVCIAQKHIGRNLT